MKFFNSKKSIILNNFDASTQNKNDFFVCNKLKIKKVLFLSICFLLSFYSYSFADVAADLTHQQGTISYMSGGIGQDESDAMEAAQGGYNLRVLNTDKAGHYSGDIRIVISDSKNKPLLDTVAGPLFYANLANGRYVVEGFSGNQHQKKLVTITGHKPIRVRFTWQQDITDDLLNQ